MNKEVDLSVSCLGKVKELKYDVIILPWGATEPHNLHLPYLTDCILPHDIAVEAAELALSRSGVRCMVMPPVPFGAHNPGQRELPFCIHTRYATQQAILEDIVSSLHVQGFRKLLILSGHGGNNFKGMIRDLAFEYPDFLIAAANWFEVVSPKGYFEAEIDDHAGNDEGYARHVSRSRNEDDEPEGEERSRKCGGEQPFACGLREEGGENDDREPAARRGAEREGRRHRVLRELLKKTPDQSGRRHGISSHAVLPHHRTYGSVYGGS